jgi:hypothetical protein
LLSLLAAFQCLCKPLLSPSPGITLLSQTGLHRLKRLLAGLPVSLGTADCLIPGQTFMGQLRLKITDRRLRFSQQPFRLFLCRRQ